MVVAPVETINTQTNKKSNDGFLSTLPMFLNELLSVVTFSFLSSFSKKQKIKTVSLNSFEDDGSPSEGFFCEKRLSKNYASAEMLTKSFVTGASVFTSSFNNKGLLIQTIDSSESKKKYPLKINNNNILF